MRALAGDGYTEAEVLSALKFGRGSRELRFRYELLDADNTHKAWLQGVLAGRVTNNFLADIKRTASFEVADLGEDVNWLSDRIKPWVYLRMNSLPLPRPEDMPQPSVEGWRSFPQGVFLLTSPTESVDSSSGVVRRDVDSFDQTLVLADDKTDARYSVAAGTNYVTEVATQLTLAGIDDVSRLVSTTLTLPVTRDWPPGTPRIEIINTLLDAINYESLFFDEDGVPVARPYATPQTRAAEFEYRDDELSVMTDNVKRSLDKFDVPNKWVVVVSEADRAALSATYTNDNPLSDTSTVRRQRTILDFRTESSDAPDQTTLDALVERLAFEASQVYEEIEVGTAIMPMHSNNDVLWLERADLGIDGKYSEREWSMELRAGATMTHVVRRVVTV